MTFHKSLIEVIIVYIFIFAILWFEILVPSPHIKSSDGAINDAFQIGVSYKSLGNGLKYIPSIDGSEVRILDGEGNQVNVFASNGEIIKVHSYLEAGNSWKSPSSGWNTFGLVVWIIFGIVVIITTIVNVYDEDDPFFIKKYYWLVYNKNHSFFELSFPNDYKFKKA